MLLVFGQLDTGCEPGLKAILGGRVRRVAEPDVGQVAAPPPPFLLASEVDVDVAHAWFRRVQSWWACRRAKWCGMNAITAA